MCFALCCSMYFMYAPRPCVYVFEPLSHSLSHKVLRGPHVVWRYLPPPAQKRHWMLHIPRRCNILRAHIRCCCARTSNERRRKENRAWVHACDCWGGVGRVHKTLLNNNRWRELRAREVQRGRQQGLRLARAAGESRLTLT